MCHFYVILSFVAAICSEFCARCFNWLHPDASQDAHTDEEEGEKKDEEDGEKEELEEEKTEEEPAEEDAPGPEADPVSQHDSKEPSGELGELLSQHVLCEILSSP